VSSFSIESVAVYVNPRTHVGHLDRHCEYLANARDGRVLVVRLDVPSPVTHRMCRHCSPVYLRPAL